jgi:hypothetical protein
MKTKLLALSLAMAAGLAPAAYATEEADLFDAAIAYGLPTDVVLPAGDGPARHIRVTERLDAGIDAGHGEDGALYLIEVDGRPGTLVRLGDELDISVDEAPATAPASRRSRRSAFQDWELFGGYGDLFEPERDHAHDPSELSSHGSGGNPGVHIWIFLHDKAGETSDAKVLNWYMSWWIRDMKTNVSPETPVRVSVRRQVAGLTDMDYHEGNDAHRIRDVAARGHAYVQDHEAAGSGLDKYLLLVGDIPRNWKARQKGGAVREYGAAIASNTGHRHVVAHEVGHLLGAADEPETKSPWHCTYNMGPMVLKASCQLYSDESAAEIRRYLSWYGPQG